MKRFQRKRKQDRLITWASTTLILVSISIVPVRLAIAQHQAPQPQAILTLGGGSEREQFTAKFANVHQDLDILVSSGIPSRYAIQIFRDAGISEERVYLDYRAADTVTNFTSMVGELKRRNIQHIYLVTSDFHMPRATAIATIVLGSQGITFTPVVIPSEEPSESSLRIARDVGRSILWLITGRTGASLNPRVAMTHEIKSLHNGQIYPRRSPDPTTAVVLSRRSVSS